MRAEVHRGRPAALLEDWARLHAGQPDASPFTSPAWAQAWWPHFAAGAEPYLACVREGDDLVGLAALVRRRRGPARVLEAVGVGSGRLRSRAALLAARARRAG